MEEERDIDKVIREANLCEKGIWLHRVLETGEAGPRIGQYKLIHFTDHVYLKVLCCKHTIGKGAECCMIVNVLHKFYDKMEGSLKWLNVGTGCSFGEHEAAKEEYKASFKAMR